MVTTSVTYIDHRNFSARVSPNVQQGFEAESSSLKLFVFLDHFSPQASLSPSIMNPYLAFFPSVALSSLLSLPALFTILAFVQIIHLFLHNSTASLIGLSLTNTPSQRPYRGDRRSHAIFISTGTFSIQHPMFRDLTLANLQPFHRLLHLL